MASHLRSMPGGYRVSFSPRRQLFLSASAPGSPPTPIPAPIPVPLRRRRCRWGSSLRLAARLAEADGLRGAGRELSAHWGGGVLLPCQGCTRRGPPRASSSFMAVGL